MDIFIKMPCLTGKSSSFSGLDMRKKWFKGSDQREIGSHIPKFLHINKKSLEFLGISGEVEESGAKIAISFKTSKYVGTIPLLEPAQCTQIGDFVVEPRFVKGNDFSVIADIIKTIKLDLNIEYYTDLKLASGRVLEPPSFLKAMKFIEILDKVVKSNWIKFGREIKYLDTPTGNVDWTNYFIHEYRVENKLRFLCSKSIHTVNHLEFGQMKYVFNLCREVISSISTPTNIRLALKDEITNIDKKLEFINNIKIDSFVIKQSDIKLVKECKKYANMILNNKFEESLGWRVDFSELFERFVQHIFEKVGQYFGGRVHKNIRFPELKRDNLSWKLSSLCPDLLLELENEVIIVDAKYKSNLYNRDIPDGNIKEEHRHDLHQILAYSSFSGEKTRVSFLCYPFSKISLNELVYLNSINGYKNKVYILGIPISMKRVNELVNFILEILRNRRGEVMTLSEF